MKYELEMSKPVPDPNSIGILNEAVKIFKDDGQPKDWKKMNEIFVKGARKNNLKNVDVHIPKNKISLITGVSGSGKSTFAFDIINSEGSLCYINAVSDELSNQISELDYDYIEGLNPSIALRQLKNVSNNPRSSVATVTDIATYLRILFSDRGVKKCPECGALNKPANGICHQCGNRLTILRGPMFSYNTQEGMCPECQGIGAHMEFDMNLLIPRPDLPIQEQPWGKDAGTIFKYVSIFFESLSEEYNYDYNLAYQDLTQEQRNILLYGTGKKQIRHRDKKKGSVLSYVYPGIIPNIRKAYSTNSEESRIKSIEKYMRLMPCNSCHGTKFRNEVLQVTYDGLTIVEWLNIEISDLYERTERIMSCEKEKYSTSDISYYALNEIHKRLHFLNKLGLDYITLGRNTNSLSGGELQHLRLAKAMGTNLGGLIYVLDEPAVNMHECDKQVIIDAVKYLRDLGNTVIVVDHNERVIKNAEYIVDFGPGGGDNGGNVCFTGTLDELMKSKDSLTGKYLRKELKIEVPLKRRKPKDWLSLEHVTKNNIKDLSLKIPLGVFLAVTGVSGTGKSTLITKVLYNEMQKKRGKGESSEEYTAALYHDEAIDDVILVNQSPIGRASRSNLATYIGVFDEIRKLYAKLPYAVDNGIKADMLSFNTTGGRCDCCEGMGVVARSVYFVHEVYSTCPRCSGKRYKDKILQLKYKEKNISDVLDMTIEEAYKLFKDEKKIAKILKVVSDVGLDYMKLGQMSTTFSGGEAQRIKLTKYLTQKKNNLLYIFDEPTTGLHIDDIKKLTNIFNRIIEEGNSIICIEHNMEVIKIADYLIDMGPHGGKNGGKILCEGTPEKVSECAESFTGQILKEYLE